LTLTLSSPPDGEPTPRIIESILEHYQEKRALEFTVQADEESIPLFGQVVIVGPVLNSYSGYVSPSNIPALRRMMKKGNAPAHVQLSLIDVKVDSTVQKYLPGTLKTAELR
jgi:hypothetical protein